MSEVFGQFTLDNITFEASYRYDGETVRQGGFHKCLVIYGGKTESGTRVSGHEYFGDDKFEVTKADTYVDDIVLHLSFPLSKEETRYTLENMMKPKTLCLSIKK